MTGDLPEGVSALRADVDDDPVEVSTEPEAGFDDPVDLECVPRELRKKFEVHSWRNGATILRHRHEGAFAEICDVLGEFRLRKSHLVKTDETGEEVAKGGGRKSLVATALDEPLTELGWSEASFETKIRVEATRRAERPKLGKRGTPVKGTERYWEPFETVEFSAPTHKVDCYKDRVALEVEWNNKNPFFDRDLNNFRLLFDLRVVEVGVIVTRCESLDELFNELLRDKAKARERYGSTTTRMKKLIPLIKGGGGGGCPVVVFGINRNSYDETT